MVSHCLVVGDKRKFLTMIVTLKCEVSTTLSEEILSIEIIYTVLVAASLIVKVCQLISFQKLLLVSVQRLEAMQKQVRV